MKILLVLACLCFISPLYSSNPHTNTVPEITLEPVLDRIFSGLPYLPPVFTRNGYYFTANNRRIYWIDQRSLKSQLLPRRILEPPVHLYHDVSALRLSDGSGYIVNSTGLQSSRLSAEELDFLIGGVQGFLPAYQTLIHEQSGSLEGFNIWGQKVIEFQLALDAKIEHFQFSHPAQILLTVRHGDERKFFGVTFGIPGESTGRPSMPVEILNIDYPRLPHRIDVLPSIHESARFLGSLFSQDPIPRPYHLYYMPGENSLYSFSPEADSPGTGGLKLLSFGDLGIRPHEMHLSPQGYVSITTAQWRFLVYQVGIPGGIRDAFDATRRAIHQQITQEYRGPNTLLASRLNNPAEFDGVIRQFNQSSLPSSITRLTGIYRILFYSIATGHPVPLTTRMSAIRVLSQQDVQWLHLDPFLAMIRYEYHVDVGVFILELAAHTSWPLLIPYSQGIGMFLTNLTRDFSPSQIDQVLALFQKLKEKLSFEALNRIFPQEFWDALIRHNPSRSVREAIQAR